jgi:NAD(P) transhydrogenase
MMGTDLREPGRGTKKRIDHYDVIVVGAGAAGRSAARTAASFGARVAIVDNNPTSGVMPLAHIAGLKLRELIRRQQQDVLASSDMLRNMIVSEALEHAMYAQQTLRELIALDLLRIGVTYIEGTARLGMSRQVHIDMPSGIARACTADSLVLATGASLIPPPGMPPDDPSVCDYRDVMCNEPLPADLLVVGAGPGAIAHASLMAALGVPVTVAVADDCIAPEMDEEHAMLLQQDLSRAGVQFFFGVGSCQVERVHGKLRAVLGDGTALRPAAVRYTSDLLPNTSGLGLLKAGVRANEAGFVEVDRYFRTTAHGIYAVGDVIGPSGSIENATMQGRAAACHIIGRATKEHVDLMPVHHVPGIPELASAGLSEAQCRAQQIACFVGRSDLDRNIRGLISSGNGKLKLVFDRSSRQLIGVHCIGGNAVDVVNIGQAVMHYGGTIEAFDALIPIEMSYGHAYQDASRDAQRRLALA